MVVARAHVRVVVAASTNGALGRDDLNRRGGRTELDRGFTSRRRATAFTRKRDYEDTGAFTEKRVTPLRYIAAAKFWPCIIFLRSANLACTIRALVTQGFAWTIHSRYYRDIINRQLVRKFDLQKVLTKYVAIAQLGERQTEDPYVSSVVTISEIWRSRVRSAVATPFCVFFCLPPPKLSYSNVFSSSPRDPRRSTSRRAPCSRHRRTEHTDNPRAPTEHTTAMVRAVARRTRSSRRPPTLPRPLAVTRPRLFPPPALVRASLFSRGSRRAASHVPRAYPRIVRRRLHLLRARGGPRASHPAPPRSGRPRPARVDHSLAAFQKSRSFSPRRRR